MTTSNILGLAVSFALSAVLASAGSVTYTCDAALQGDGTCAILNSTIAALYNSTFTNANAGVYIKYGSTGLASTLQYSTNITYTAYVNALTSHESGVNDVKAVNSLGGNATNPVVGVDGVTVTSALAQVLGLAVVAGSVGTDTAGNSCTLGTPNCYNGIVTLSSAANTWYHRSGSQPSGTYDIYSAVEHETDEVLGTPSCLTTSGGSPGTSVNCTNHTALNPAAGVSAADLFRYASSGTRSFLSTANGSAAYFSINGGVTSVAGYNNTPNGADYGDWNSASLRVQNAYGTPDTTGTDITNDGGSEIMVLDAVGYNLANTTTPEPGTLGLFAVSFAALIAYRVRRTQPV